MNQSINCLDPDCLEVAEELEEYMGQKIRTCKNGHRTAKYLEEQQNGKSNS